MPESKEGKRGVIVLNIKTLSVTGIATLALFVFAIAPAWKDSPNNMAAPLTSYIVQAGSLELAVQAVQGVGGEITHELGIINSVGAHLTEEQRAALDADQRIRTYINREAQVSGYLFSEDSDSEDVEKMYGSVVSSPDLHEKGIDGRGVTVIFTLPFHGKPVC